MSSDIDYQQIFKSLPGRFIAYYPDYPNFSIAEISAEQAELSMVKRDKVVGKPFLDVFPDTSEKFKKTGQSDAIKLFQTVLKTGKPVFQDTTRYDLKDKQGKLIEKYWKSSTYPIKDNRGKVALLYTTSEDVTESRNTNIALQESESEFKFLANSMPQLVWVTRPDGYHEYYNQQWYEYTGTTPGQTEGEGWNALFHPEDQKRAWKIWNNSLKTGEPYEIEYRLWHAPSKEYRWVIGRALAFKDDQGNIRKWYGTCTDIDAQKKLSQNSVFLAEASKILASTLDYRRTLLQVAKMMVPHIADWCSVEILTDKKELKQVAVAHKDPKQVKWAKELRKQQGPPDLNEPAGLPNVLRTGKSEMYPHIPDELLVASAKDEDQLKLLRQLGMSSVIIVPLKVRSETIGAITLISTDLQRHYTPADLRMAEELAVRASLAMTNAHLFQGAKQELVAREQLQRELKKANNELEKRVKQRTSELQESNLDLKRSNNELESFAYVASHDLQEPLRKIQAFSDLLEAEYSAKLGDGKDYVRRMHSAASRMSTLIEDLLAFSRVSTKPRENETLDLNKIVAAVVDDLETRIADTNGKVAVGELPSIQADPLQMRQLFQNLIGNALKFHKELVPPVVTIKAAVEKPKNGKIQSCRIEVEDNGVGFDAKYIDRIFAVFQRLHSRDSYGGTGIGLAVCRKIVERHDGTITAESKPGVGSKFIITLPLRQKEETTHG